MIDADPLCSVCIANYNGVGLIDACIQSVLAQDCDFNVEIIVHDDASTDDSVNYIRQHYPQVKLLVGSQNVGFCISNNRMVDAASGKYLLLLNNDASLFPDALRTLHNSAKEIGDPAILGLPQYSADTRELIDIGSRLDLFLNPIPNQNRNQTSVGMVIGACFWLPRTLWDELGGFPDWFGSLAEDMLLCCLARLYGYEVMVLNQSGFTHWVGQSLGGGKVLDNKLTTKLTRRATSERNKNYVMYLTYPAPFLQLLLPLHALLLLLEGLILAGIKHNLRLFRDIYLQSITSLCTENKKLAATRRQIQLRRRCGRMAFFDSFDYLPHKLRLLFRHGVPEIKE